MLTRNFKMENLKEFFQRRKGKSKKWFRLVERKREERNQRSKLRRSKPRKFSILILLSSISSVS
jgi:hypothetical protein